MHVHVNTSRTHMYTQSFNLLLVWLCNCYKILYSYQSSMYTHVHTRTHTYTHTRTYTYTHTHTHTHRYVVGTVFGFEHLLLVVAVWLQWAIKPEPKWVRLAVARREYLARERRRGEYKKEEEGKQITEEERDKDD